MNCLKCSSSSHESKIFSPQFGSSLGSTLYKNCGLSSVRALRIQFEGFGFGFDLDLNIKVPVWFWFNSVSKFFEPEFQKNLKLVLGLNFFVFVLHVLMVFFGIFSCLVSINKFCLGISWPKTLEKNKLN